jgi:NAD(P)-dependent dehydrogenase (short-subunit alcohol dehydrogenase family)
MGPIVIVTGATRGIGREVARQLAGAGASVVVTGRDEAQARAVADELGTRHLVLDVAHDESVSALASRLGTGVDILVNNAGIALKGFDADLARRTIDTNFFGVRRVTEALLPLMRKAGRIVMVSSGMGELTCVGEPLRDKLARLDVSEQQLVELMRAFPEQVARGAHGIQGWPSSAYRVSKVGLNVYTRLLSERLREDPRSLLVNAVCPGWVRTDLGGSSAPRSVEEGARGIVWAALLPPNGPSGGFFRDGQAIDW